MQLKKTGELMGFCCESAAIVAGVEDDREKLKEVGLNLGLLFQISDDLLDRHGDTDKIGKPTKQDEIKGKATIMSAIGEHQTKKLAQDIQSLIKENLVSYGDSARTLVECANYILKEIIKMNKLLDKINFPSDLRLLDRSQLPQLADELRKELISAVSETGGHLGAGLGVIELTIALHYMFDTPKDRLIWDVGHQAYPHKILTGRKDRIRTLRQGGGLSGFTKRSESNYDPFGAAHSSTSISAGLGMSVARDIEGKTNNIISVIGDGAMSAGMAYEAMNNAGSMVSD